MMTHFASERFHRKSDEKFEIHSARRSRLAINKVNWASSKGGYLHTEGSATIPKTRARMTTSLDHAPTESELFRETHKESPSFLQTSSNPLNRCKRRNRVYGAGGFFAGSLRTSDYGGSYASGPSTQAGPASETEVVDLKEHVQNLMQSLENKGQVLQQYIDEVQSLKDILAQKDAWGEDHLRRME
ncbi:hypothetical protein PIB30_013312 [Stylosanthes scabra]|uniref:Uncharacterized protein n=1 Tax=Stylosanthes scabra TaxID=79078 RepID=A0ABU6T8D5_9FABA|nr:hypothetical protein [Stylosanthes scabra]